jgi:HSP20 family molecular chaperone IbpA
VPVRLTDSESALALASREGGHLWVAAEIAHTETEYRIRLTMPGCDEKHIRVSAAPKAIVVEGLIGAPFTVGMGEILSSEFGSRRMHRVIELPEEIVAEQARAHLHNGLLTVIVEKAAVSRRRRFTGAAATVRA